MLLHFHTDKCTSLDIYAATDIAVYGKRVRLEIGRPRFDPHWGYFKKFTIVALTLVLTGIYNGSGSGQTAQKRTLVRVFVFRNYAYSWFISVTLHEN